MEFKEQAERIDIVLTGELDSRTSHKVKTEILELLGDKKKDVYLDIREVRYIDSGAINLMITLHKALLSRQKKFFVASPSETVSRILKLGNLDKVLNIV